MNRILVVEDESHLARGLQFNLEAEGYRVEVVETGEEALEKLMRSDSDHEVMVLDIMLPGIDGFSVISRLREAGQYIPTLMLTARGQANDVLRGLSAGADDYLAKPFELAILIARIQGLLRRKNWAWQEQAANEPARVERYRFGTNGDRLIDFDRLELQVQSRQFRLTLMESNLLRYLASHEGEALSRKRLLAEVWDLRENTDTRAIDNFMVRLRRYIEDDPAMPKHLQTVRGVGYRFVAFPQ